MPYGTSEMINKLVLGTAQFGLDYGIDNPAGRISEGEVHSLLKMASNAGIDSLDTAFAYGESEAVLGRIFRGTDSGIHFKITTKMAPGQAAPTALGDSLARLGCRSVHGYLLHDFNATRSGNLSQYRAMRAAVEQGLVEKGGFSLYYPFELQHALDAGLDFELVQFPYSLLDRRFEPYFPMLNDMGVEVHVRSVYLQGLVFLDDDRLTGRLAKARESIGRLRAKAQKYHCGIAEVCLRFALSHPSVDRVVIGVNGIGNLAENIGYGLAGVLDQDMLSELNDLAIDDESVLLPFLWNREK